MRFDSPRERYNWLVKTGLAVELMKFKAFFGEIKLTNVGRPPFPPPLKIPNKWEGYGLKNYDQSSKFIYIDSKLTRNPAYSAFSNTGKIRSQCSHIHRKEELSNAASCN